MFDKSLIYPLFALLVGVSALLIIPKNLYKHCLLYGIIFGAIGDTISVLIFSKIFHLFQYKNMGVFNVLNIFSIWTPITWMFIFTIFFYLMPVRKQFLIPYILAFIGLNFSVGTVMEALSLVVAKGGLYKLIDLSVFTFWYSIAAWVYIRNRDVSLK